MSEVLQRNSQELESIAKGKGLVVIYPNMDELLLDLDAGMHVRAAVLEALEQNGIRMISTLTVRSQSNKNFHTYYRLNQTLATSKRVGLQAMLGSDPVRETLSLLRLHEDVPPTIASVLFEIPATAKKVKAWQKKGR